MARANYASVAFSVTKEIEGILRRLRTLETRPRNMAVVAANPADPGAGRVWFRSDTGQLTVFDGTATQTFAAGPLANEVTYQLWSASTTVALTTSFVFFTSSTTNVVTKLFANTRIKAHIDLAYNNPDASNYTYEFAMYEKNGVGGDSLGQWPIVRKVHDTSSRTNVSGTRILGVAGRYPTGSLEFAIAVRVTTGTGNIATVLNQHSWSIEIQEVW